MVAVQPRQVLSEELVGEGLLRDRPARRARAEPVDGGGELLVDVVVGGPFCWEHPGEAFLTVWGKQAKLDGL